jgi:hypothetical protein
MRSQMWNMIDMNSDASLFHIFGGVRPMARAIGVSPSNVAAWKQKGRIPAEMQPLVLERGLALGLSIAAENVVFPLGRSHIDITSRTSPVACALTRKAQNFDAETRSK